MANQSIDVWKAKSLKATGLSWRQVAEGLSAVDRRGTSPYNYNSVAAAVSRYDRALRAQKEAGT